MAAANSVFQEGRAMAKKKSKRSKARASWSGTLRFGLVTFGVQAFNARVREAGTVAFHQLHESCHNRIRHEKVCPVHGPISNDEIISGYEFSDGEYVEIDEEELGKLRTQKDKAINVDAFVEPDEIDPIYFDGRMYYLVPDGDDAVEPFSIFLEALRHEERVGIGVMVFSGKEQVALLRPYGDVLNLAMLNYASEIRAAEEVVAEMPTVKRDKRKVQLAERLIASWGDKKFNFANYVDPYYEQVKKLIKAKVEGRELVAPDAEDEPHVINLMEALRKSLAKSDKPESDKRSSKSRQRRSPSARRRGAS
jgi:DNA end-binding protein Ku